MAIYTYKCNNENEEHIVEHKYSMLENRPEILECPICGADSKRVFQPATFILKGTGWYSTAIDRPKNVVDNTSI